ncbi:MAG: flagellin [Lachnospiraceae bacterium]|nr:flagellin [Butyrivibrio sp.]MCM1410286.1 flagellin [Lachnospiraceae bacterium]
MAAMNVGRQLNLNNKKQVKNTEKLSSGYRINRSADDAAGLAISEKMRRQVRGLRQSVFNIEEGTGYIQTAEGALNEVEDMLQRMNELAVHGANDTLQAEDRQYIDKEVQALKQELDRVFRTTSFNDRLIWEADPDTRVQIGTELLQAVTFRNTYNSFDVTDKNCGVVPASNPGFNAYFTIAATKADGVSVSWTAYDGTKYTTDFIDWDTLKENNYEFEMSDYFGGSAKYPSLYKDDGSPQFTHKVAFDVVEAATVDDIITCINNRTMTSSSRAYYTPRFEDADANPVSYSNVSLNSANLYYQAAYASSQATADKHTFDGEDDLYLEPTSHSGNLTSIPSGNTSDVSVAQASSEKWTFSFEMSGVGPVKATSTGVYYASPSSTEEKDEGLWWHWVNYADGTRRKYATERYIGGGTLGNVMDALTGSRTERYPGLLQEKDGGISDHGGYIDIYFSLLADSAYTFGNGLSSRDVGSVKIRVSVLAGDTEQTVLDRINAALKSDTVLDFYTSSRYQDSSSADTAYAATHKIDSPIYGGAVHFWVQAGPEADQQIDIYYDALSCIFLKLNNTKADTVNNCKAAIGAVKNALKTVNAQRAEFGAYQNRLEHAANSNRNMEENTQAAESLIRDTDMASAMVEYANHNILLQAGQAMLAQANRMNQGILSLLQ